MEGSEGEVAGIALGLASGIAFGSIAVAIRLGQVDRDDDDDAGALTLVAASAVVPALLAVTLTRIDPRELWPFFLTGAVVPGAAQLLNVRAVRAAGAARTSLLLGTAPLASAVAAVSFLAEPVGVPLATGILLVVLGGMALAWERTRPDDFRSIGAVLALTCALLFAARDVGVRWLARGDDVPALAAAAATLLGGACAVLLYVLALRGARPALAVIRNPLPGYVVAGCCLGLAITALYAALDRANVTIVSPLTAAGSLWTLVLAALLLGRREAIGVRLVAAVLLIVSGGALIGVSR